MFQPLDKGLKGPPLAIEVARDIVPYDVWQNADKRKELREWLAAVEADNLKPFITIEIGETFDFPRQVAAYRNDVSQLMRALMHGAPAVVEHKEIIEPAVPQPVRKWGAVNEPDNPARSSVAHDARAAAELWKIADSIAENPKNACGLCRVAAGEFSEPNEGYIKTYKNEILTDHAYGKLTPRVWSFHDYSDLVHLQEHEEAHEGNYNLDRVLGWIGLTSSEHVWLSEQGLELKTEDDKPTDLEQPYPVPGTKKVITPAQRQIAAARDFLRLAQSDSRIDLVDYYLYRGPTKKQQKEENKAFDSALVESEAKAPQRHREAYCVLVEDKLHGCPPPKLNTGHAASVTTSTATLNGLVNPEELPTTYSFEYGTTTNYGNRTTVAELPNPEGEQQATAQLSGLAECTTYHYRVTAENEASEGNEPGEATPSVGDDETFQTPCRPAKVQIVFERYESSEAFSRQLVSHLVLKVGEERREQTGILAKVTEAEPPIEGGRVTLTFVSESPDVLQPAPEASPNPFEASVGAGIYVDSVWGSFAITQGQPVTTNWTYTTGP